MGAYKSEEVLIFGNKFRRINDIVEIKYEDRNKLIKGRITGFSDGIEMFMDISKNGTEGRARLFIPSIEKIDDEVIIFRGENVQECEAGEVITYGDTFFRLGRQLTVTYKKWFSTKSVTGKLSDILGEHYIKICSTENYEAIYTKIDVSRIKNITEVTR